MFIDLIETFSTRQRYPERRSSGRHRGVLRSFDKAFAASMIIDRSNDSVRIRTGGLPQRRMDPSVSRVAVNCARAIAYGLGANLGSNGE